MLRLITQQLQPATRSRCYSQLLAATATAPSAASKHVRYPYYVPRNTQGSIPVYTDYRNHNRVLTLIRNVEGNADALATDLINSLVEPGSPEAARLKATVSRGRHVVLGGNWKRQVMRWLESKGF